MIATIHRLFAEISSSPARLSCLVLGAVMIPASGAFYRQTDLAASIWPWPDDRMSFIFLSSVGLAIAGVCFFAALTGEIGGLTPILMEVALTVVGMAGYLAFRAARDRDGSELLLAGALLAAAAGSSAVFRRSRRIRFLDSRILPFWARIVCAALVLLLGAIGLSLIAQTDGAFPWELKPQTSTMFGFIFSGAAALFAFIVARPRWTYLATALAGFLAYDLVLFVPYLRALLGNDDSRTSSMYRTASGTALDVDDRQMVVYLVTLAVSAVVTIALLFVHRSTRVWGAQARKFMASTG